MHRRGGDGRNVRRIDVVDEGLDGGRIIDRTLAQLDGGIIGHHQIDLVGAVAVGSDVGRGVVGPGYLLAGAAGDVKVTSGIGRRAELADIENRAAQGHAVIVAKRTAQAAVDAELFGGQRAFDGCAGRIGGLVDVDGGGYQPVVAGPVAGYHPESVGGAVSQQGSVDLHRVRRGQVSAGWRGDGVAVSWRAGVGAQEVFDAGQAIAVGSVDGQGDDAVDVGAAQDGQYRGDFQVRLRAVHRYGAFYRAGAAEGVDGGDGEDVDAVAVQVDQARPSGAVANRVGQGMGHAVFLGGDADRTGRQVAVADGAVERKGGVTEDRAVEGGVDRDDGSAMVDGEGTQFRYGDVAGHVGGADPNCAASALSQEIGGDIVFIPAGGSIQGEPAIVGGGVAIEVDAILQQRQTAVGVNGRAADG